MHPQSRFKCTELFPTFDFVTSSKKKRSLKIVSYHFADAAVSISIPESVNIFNRKRASIAFHYRPTIVLM